MISIEVLAGETVLAAARHPRTAQLYVKGAYPETACLRVTAPEGHLWVQVDQVIAPTLLFLPNGSLTYAIPRREQCRAYPPQAFRGEGHAIRAWLPDEHEIYARRNLAFNPADQRGAAQAFPHASANVETRDEAVFAARNVIDGWTFNTSHGDWPFQSWGIGARDDAWCLLEFGREVLVDETALVLRADFPHDAHWVSGCIIMSDGSVIPLAFQKTAEPQRIALGDHHVTWMRLEQLVKSSDASAFPALSQWEVYGRDPIILHSGTA